MIINEVNEMDEQLRENEELSQSKPYIPRPLWQIIAAWFGVAIVFIGFLLYVYQIATGG